MTENEVNVPSKLPKLKTMDDVLQGTEQKEADSNKVVKSSEETQVGAIAHKKSTYNFDPSLEPLLRDNPRRFVIFPIEYPDIWQMYKKVCIYS